MAEPQSLRSPRSYLRFVNAGCGVLLIAFLVNNATVTPRSGKPDDPSRFADYLLVLQSSRYSEVTGQQDPGSAYPPITSAMRLAWASVGYERSAWAWVGLNVLAAIGCVCLALRLGQLGAHPLRYALSLAAVLAVGYYVEWDLRSCNCNFIYLFLVLLATSFLARMEESDSGERIGVGAASSGRWWLALGAGTTLAASVAVKLYSVLFGIYLLWRRRYRVLLAAAITTVLLFVLIPVSYWGFGGAYRLTAGWLEVVRATDSTHTPRDFCGYLVSTQRTLLVLLGDVPSSTCLVSEPWSDDAVFALTKATQSIWLVGVVAVIAAGGGPQTSRRMRLTLDCSALLLLPLPLGPLLQPHHLVVTLLPMVLFVRFLADGSQCRWLRLVLLAIAAGGWLLLEAGPRGDYRGIGGAHSHSDDSARDLARKTARLRGSPFVGPRQKRSPACTASAREVAAIGISRRLGRVMAWRRSVELLHADATRRWSFPNGLGAENTDPPDRLTTRYPKASGR